jgi:hypothetical protein
MHALPRIEGQAETSRPPTMPELGRTFHTLEGSDPPYVGPGGSTVDTSDFSTMAIAGAVGLCALAVIGLVVAAIYYVPRGR